MPEVIYRPNSVCADQRCGRAECNRYRRRLPDDLKAGRPEIPCPKLAGIGYMLRHNYEDIAAPVMWKLMHDYLPVLENRMPRRINDGTGEHTGLPATHQPARTSSSPLRRHPFPYHLAPSMLLPRPDGIGAPSYPTPPRAMTSA